MQLQNPQLLRQQALIGNEWQDADSQARFDVANPANGAVISSVPDMGAAETRRASALPRNAAISCANGTNW